MSHTLTRAALAPLILEDAAPDLAPTRTAHTSHRRTDATRSDTARAAAVDRRRARHVKRDTPHTAAGRARRVD